MGYEPYYYNSEYLDCMDKWVVFRAGRKVGKSTSTAVKALHFAWFAPFLLNTVKTKCDILMVAPTQNQAVILLDLAKDFAERSILKSFVTKSIATEMCIRMINGQGLSRIYTRAAGDRGDSVRGYIPHVMVLDEAEYLRKAVYASLMPSGIATNARVWLTSTPGEQLGFFYDACMNSKAGSPSLAGTEFDNKDGLWTQFHATSLQNPSVRGSADAIAMLKSLSKDVYKRDVLGEFLAVGNALIPRDLLLEAIGDVQVPPNVEYYMGVDVARGGNDDTVYTILAVDQDQSAYVVETHRKGSTLLTEVVDDIEDYARRYGRNLRVIYCDETGVGGGVVDFARNRGLPVQGVVFSSREKEGIYKNLLMLFEQRRITLGGTQTELFDQLTMLQKHYTEIGIMKITSYGDDDMADSLALSCKALEVGDQWGVLDVKGHDLFT